MKHIADSAFIGLVVLIVLYALRGDIVGHRPALKVAKTAGFETAKVVSQSGLLAFAYCGKWKYDVAYDVIAKKTGEERTVAVTVCCEMRPLTPQNCEIK